MKTIKFDKIKYVSCDIILQDAPIYSKGCRNTRNIIKNKNIPEDEYLYARYNKETNKSIKVSVTKCKNDNAVK